MNDTTARIIDTMGHAGFIVHTVRFTGPDSAVVTWEKGTDEKAAATALAAFNWSEAAQTLWEKQQRANSVDGDDKAKTMLALLAAENNALRSWLTQFKAVVAAAGSLAALKTGVAGLPALPQRTKPQVIAAYKAESLGN